MEKDLVIIIKENDDKKIINYLDLKNRNYFIEKNIETILKRIFDINTGIKIKYLKQDNEFKFEVYEKEKLYCTGNSTVSYYQNRSILQIKKDNTVYEYLVTFIGNKIEIILQRLIYEKNNTHYTILIYNDTYFIEIKNNDNRTLINIQDENYDIKKIFETTISIENSDDVTTVYNKIIRVIKQVNNLEIKKNKILDKKTTTEIPVGTLTINEGVLIDYLNTIDKNGKKYTIKKEGNNYSYILNDSTTEDFLSSYFDFSEQVQFIKKLEKKKDK